LQSSLGRGKSWALAENISSQTGKKYFKSNMENISAAAVTSPPRE